MKGDKKVSFSLGLKQKVISEHTVLFTMLCSGLGINHGEKSWIRKV